MNDEASIEAARPVAEQFRNALASALKAEGGEWRSLDLQVGLATGIIASAIQAAKLEAYQEAAKVIDVIHTPSEYSSNWQEGFKAAGRKLKVSILKLGER